MNKYSETACSAGLIRGVILTLVSSWPKTVLYRDELGLTILNILNRDDQTLITLTKNYWNKKKENKSHSTNSITMQMITYSRSLFESEKVIGKLLNRKLAS